MNFLQEKKYSPNQKGVIEQTKFSYSPLGKAFEKQTKKIKEQGKKQVEALKTLTEKELESIEGIFPKHMRTDEIKNEIDEIKKWEDKIKRKDWKYKAGKHKYDFQQCETIRSFGIHEADMDQTNLLENMVKFSNKSRPKTKQVKDKKQNTFDRVNALYEGRELILNAFRRGIFPIKKLQGR